MTSPNFLTRQLSRTNTDRTELNRLRNRVRSTWDAYKASPLEVREEAYQRHVSAQEMFERASLNVSRLCTAQLGDG